MRKSPWRDFFEAPDAFRPEARSPSAIRAFVRMTGSAAYCSIDPCGDATFYHQEGLSARLLNHGPFADRLRAALTIKLTILGSGTSAPHAGRNSAGYFVETGDSKIMLDCGAGTLHALARFDVKWQEMTHLFISHFHVDHIGELAGSAPELESGAATAVARPAAVDADDPLAVLAYGKNPPAGPRAAPC